MDSSNAVYTNQRGDNSDLFLQVSKLYFKNGYSIADVTYGKGVFWRKLDLSKYDFHPSDLLTVKNAPYDFRHLPYEANKFDVVVFDPPYCHNPGKMMVDKNYRNAETTKGLYHLDILNLYWEGMVEAKRVLKPKGIILVKCKDEIESSVQQWSHTEIQDLANKIGLYAKDLFILCPNSSPVVQFNQQHARKNHSYLWIFKKYETAGARLPWFVVPIGVLDDKIQPWIEKQNQHVVVRPEIYRNILTNTGLDVNPEDPIIWSYILVDIRKALIELKNVILHAKRILNTEFRKTVLSKLPACRKKAVLFPADHTLIEQSDLQMRRMLYNLEADYNYTRDVIDEENFDIVEKISD